MGQSRQQKHETAMRRQLVANLWLRRTPKPAIAEAVGCDLKTVYRDLDCIEAKWQDELNAEFTSQRARDLAATDNLQWEAARNFIRTGNETWWDRVMKALERRAKLLGLDSTQAIPGSSPETPLYIAPGHIDWDALPIELAERFLAINDEIVALQPASGGLIVDPEYEVEE